MDKVEFKRRVAEYTYRLMHWGNRRLPPGIRTLAGFLFMVGGVFGFLPVLGFWMLPLGVAFIALDVPPPAGVSTSGWNDCTGNRKSRTNT